MSEEKLSGIDELRALVGRFGYCREDFNTRFTVDQLIQLNKMWLASEWDIYPDEWTQKQIDAALAGTPPRWNESERPID